MNRYRTRGVNATIPLAAQLYLWQLYDSIPRGHRDWLQIFRISPEEDHLKILHEQEIPEYRRAHRIHGVPSSSAKVYIVSEDNYEMMLLADEY